MLSKMDLYLKTQVTRTDDEVERALVAAYAERGYPAVIRDYATLEVSFPYQVIARFNIMNYRAHAKKNLVASLESLAVNQVNSTIPAKR